MAPRKKTPKLPSSTRQVLADNVNTFMRIKFEKHGDKVKVLAKKSGVSRSTAQRVLNAQHGTNVDTIEALARVLGVEPYELVKRWPK